MCRSSALVAEFDTTMTAIQAVITLYCLVMAMFMMTGARVGDIIGRQQAFVCGLPKFLPDDHCARAGRDISDRRPPAPPPATVPAGREPRTARAG